ncbi:MAG: hypothetical protein ACIPMY_02910 [Rickettsia endosymbiont of Pentastiridius leporinus]
MRSYKDIIANFSKSS